MTGAQEVRDLLQHLDVTTIWLARRTGMSRHTLARRLVADNFREDELELIRQACADIRAVLDLA